ncbi:MAG: transporter [Lachnospiraceae bacterium]|nr:transporter [Lachnospiraceae bacterium]
MNQQTEPKQKKSSVIIWIILHILLAVYTLSGVCSKLAAQEAFLSFRFCAYYGGLLFLLGLYALGWQQIIKRLPLTVAYANKAVSVIWACIYGVLFFGEKITAGKIIGGAVTIAGVVLYALSDRASEAKTTSTVNEADADKITPDVKSGEEEGE